MTTSVFVLMLWMWPGSSAGTGFSAEFDGEQACRNAAQTAIKEMAGDQWKQASVRYVCVPKKVTP